jgi:hypothetical protein
VAWLFVALVGELTVYLMAWGASWGSGTARANEIYAASGLAAGGPPVSVGAQLVGFWSGLVRMIVLAFGHSFLWTAATGVYLLLRRDTDGTPLDEIFPHGSEVPSSVPPLTADVPGRSPLGESRHPETVGSAMP